MLPPPLFHHDLEKAPNDRKKREVCNNTSLLNGL